MFLEIHCGRLYVDGEQVDYSKWDRSISRSLWVEGVTREEVSQPWECPGIYHWVWNESEQSQHAYQERVLLTFFARCGIVVGSVAISSCFASYAWSLWWLLLAIPSALLTGITGIVLVGGWQERKQLYRRFRSGELNAVEFDYSVIRYIRLLLQSGLSQSVRKRLEAGAGGGSVDSVNTNVVSISHESVARVVRRNPELIEFISKEYGAKLPSPDEYRRRAFDVLYGYIQDEINRLEADRVAAEEQRRIEAKRKATEEALRRSREEREALVAAEADRASRVSSLPFILGESEDEVIAWGSLSQAMLEADSDSTCATDRKEPKKA